MKTPICDFVRQYIADSKIRMHMHVPNVTIAGQKCTAPADVRQTHITQPAVLTESTSTDVSFSKNELNVL